MSTIYCDLKKGFNKNDIISTYKDSFSKKTFIDIIDNNITADFYSVCNTNKCLIKLYDHYSNDKIIIISLIDNLLKGASGQAVQCMNLIFDFDENNRINLI